jgi:hypothetical protein
MHSFTAALYEYVKYSSLYVHVFRTLRSFTMHNLRICTLLVRTLCGYAQFHCTRFTKMHTFYCAQVLNTHSSTLCTRQHPKFHCMHFANLQSFTACLVWIWPLHIAYSAIIRSFTAHTVLCNMPSFTVRITVKMHSFTVHTLEICTVSCHALSECYRICTLCKYSMHSSDSATRSMSAHKFPREILL